MREIICVTFVVVLLGCDDRSGGESCLAYETQSCLCVGGGTGVQTCNEDGDGWSPCDCGGTDSGTDPDVAYDGPCRNDDDCDNGDECDGVETCDAGDCVAGTAVVCDDSDDCTTDRCDEADGECVYEDRDEDDDGYIDGDCGGDDCDDTRDDVYPGAVEDSCYDDVDQACDGVTGPHLLQEDLLLDNTAASRSSPDIVWTGSEFGTTWNGGQAAFQRISAGGTVVGGTVEGGDAGHYYTQVIWTGSRYGVARHQVAGVTVDFLDAEGVVVSSDHRIGGATDALIPYSTSWVEDEIDVVWSGSEDLMLTRTDALGSPVGTDLDILSYLPGEQYDALSNLVWTGSELGVTVAGGTTSPDNGLYLVTLDRSGTLTGQTTLASELGMEGQNGHDVLGWSGSEFAAVWLEDRAMLYQDLHFARLDADGSMIGTSVVLTPPEAQAVHPTVQWTGSEWNVAWYGIRAVGDPYLDIFFTRVSADGAEIGSEVKLTGYESLYDHIWFNMAWTGSEHGIVWEDSLLGEIWVWFNRIGYCS